MGANRGTYLVELSDGTKIVCGNNYKPWYTHVCEYAFRKYEEGRPHAQLLKSVQVSSIQFVDDGGLKWADPKAYDEVIDEMNAKDGGRRIPFKHIAFHPSDVDYKKLEKELKYWGVI